MFRYNIKIESYISSLVYFEIQFSIGNDKYIVELYNCMSPGNGTRNDVSISAGLVNTTGRIDNSRK